MATLEEGLNTHLRASAAVTALVSNRIRPIRRRAKDGTGDAITYRRKRGGFQHDLSGGTGRVHAIVEISCWSQDYDDAKAIAEAVRNELQGNSGTMNGLDAISITLLDEEDDYIDPSDGSDNGWFVCVVDYLIIRQNPIPVPTI